MTLTNSSAGTFVLGKFRALSATGKRTAAAGGRQHQLLVEEVEGAFPVSLPILETLAEVQ